MKKLLLLTILLMPGICFGANLSATSVSGTLTAVKLIETPNALAVLDTTISTQTKLGGLNIMGYTGHGTTNPATILSVVSPPGLSNPAMQISTGTSILFEVNPSSVVMNVSTLTVNGNIKAIGMQSDFAIYRDTKAANTGGGTSATGFWIVRDLNETQAEVGVSITRPHTSSSTFTLTPGIYKVRGSVPTHNSNVFTARITNISIGQLPVLLGSSELAAAGSYSVKSELLGIINSTGTFNYQVEVRVNLGEVTNGLGNPVNFSAKEVYTQIEIQRLQ